tara:strand:+ start:21 stop:743 length:723 start_codon:yes stop_codon:yes gene_type:complete
MAKISTYPISTPVVDADKWIGTDSKNLNQTKNFTAADVALYLNNKGKVESDSLRYKYQNWITGDDRENGTISFAASNAGDTVAFNTITTFMLSKFVKSLVDVSSFYTNPLIGSQVMISQSNNTSEFGIYAWNSSAQDGVETNFYDIGLTFVTGNGTLKKNQDYFISLLQYDTASSVGDKNFTETVSLSTTWTVNHNLNKYPAVSILDTAGTEVYGQIDYVSLTQVVITFVLPVAGRVTCN